MSNSKSSYYQKGRADAAKGKGVSVPSRGGIGGLLLSDKENEKWNKRQEEYREGYYDKKNQK